MKLVDVASSQLELSQSWLPGLVSNRKEIVISKDIMKMFLIYLATEEELILHFVGPNLGWLIAPGWHSEVKPVALHEQVAGPRSDLAGNIRQ